MSIVKGSERRRGRGREEGSSVGGEKGREGGREEEGRGWFVSKGREAVKGREPRREKTEGKREEGGESIGDGRVCREVVASLGS